MTRPHDPAASPRTRNGGVLASAAALTVLLAACAPRAPEPAPPAGMEMAELEPPSDLLGGPEPGELEDPLAEAPPTPLGPEPWPATPGEPSPEAAIAAELAAPMDQSPAYRAAPPAAASAPVLAEAAPAAEGVDAGPDVIGQPALPRDYAALSVRRGPGAPRPTLAGAPEPSPAPTVEPMEMATAPVTDGVAAADASAAPAASAAVVAGTATMAPIPDPAEPARPQLLGAPAAAGEAPRVSSRVATSAPATRREAGAATPPRQPAASSASRQGGPASERTADLKALSAALTASVAKEARLTGAEGLVPGQAGEVALTLPASLAATLRERARALGVRDARTNPEVKATLAGAGYVVEPSTAQSAPLKTDEAAAFRWRVTPERGARDALSATVNAEVGAAGRRETLRLGAVAAPASTAATAPARRGSQRVWWALGLLTLGGVGLFALLRGLGGGTRARRTATSSSG